MFTGIITHIGVIKNVEFSSTKDCLLVISVKQKILRTLDIGCSIACDGICLTLIKKVKNEFYFQASQETCAKTTLSKWFVGKKINLEFALRVGDEFGGHIVSGHVDGRAKLKALKPVKDSVAMTFELEKNSTNLAKFIAKKGSICLNGVSLTVNESAKILFTVNVISHSLKNTTFAEIKVGDLVNLEIDLIARYLERASSGNLATK